MNFYHLEFPHLEIALVVLVSLMCIRLLSMFYGKTIGKWIYRIRNQRAGRSSRFDREDREFEDDEGFPMPAEDFEDFEDCEDRDKTTSNDEHDEDFAFTVRKFLNMPGKMSDANIVIQINENNQKEYYIKIKDCHNEALLHGSLGTVSSFENGIFKIDTLITALQQSRAFIIENCGEFGLCPTDINRLMAKYQAESKEKPNS